MYQQQHHRNSSHPSPQTPASSSTAPVTEPTIPKPKSFTGSPKTPSSGKTTNSIAPDDITAELRVIRVLHILVVAHSCCSGTLMRCGDMVDNNAELKPSERDFYLEKLKPLNRAISSPAAELSPPPTAAHRPLHLRRSPAVEPQMMPGPARPPRWMPRQRANSSPGSPCIGWQTVSM